MSRGQGLHQKMVFGRRVRVLAALLAEGLPRGARVLDVGCGDGSIAAAVMQQRPDVEITGIDVLVRPDTQIPVAEYDGTHIPSPDGSYDVVTLVDVLHHAEDATALLTEAARVASASVGVKDHVSEGALDHTTLRVMDWAGNASFGVALPYTYLSESEWAGAFVSAGLDVERRASQLSLYPPPISWVCDRDLQALWWLTPSRGAL